MFSVLFPLCSLAQVYTLSGSIKDSKGEPMANVSIEVKDNISFNTFSDERGLFVISNLPKGTYQLQFSHVGLNPISRTFRIESDRETQIVFSQDEINIDEVHVTAKESKNISTSSIITRDAMQHLQPSSIADILELLPGGRTGTHALDQVRGINLRTPTNFLLFTAKCNKFFRNNVLGGWNESELTVHDRPYPRIWNWCA